MHAIPIRHTHAHTPLLQSNGGGWCPHRERRCSSEDMTKIEHKNEACTHACHVCKHRMLNLDHAREKHTLKTVFLHTHVFVLSSGVMGFGLIVGRDQVDVHRCTLMDVCPRACNTERRIQQEGFTRLQCSEPHSHTPSLTTRGRPGSGATLSVLSTHAFRLRVV